MPDVASSASTQGHLSDGVGRPPGVGASLERGTVFSAGPDRDAVGRPDPAHPARRVAR